MHGIEFVCVYPQSQLVILKWPSPYQTHTQKDCFVAYKSSLQLTKHFIKWTMQKCIVCLNDTLHRLANFFGTYVFKTNSNFVSHHFLILFNKHIESKGKCSPCIKEQHLFLLFNLTWILFVKFFFSFRHAIYWLNILINLNINLKWNDVNNVESESTKWWKTSTVFYYRGKKNMKKKQHKVC